MKKTALLMGATGLVGRKLLKILLSSQQYGKIVVLSRRNIGMEDPKLVQVVTPFDQLEKYQTYFCVDEVYSCIGTTIKKAKTKENFVKVDYGYALSAAKLAKEAGAKQFLTISAIGANPNSFFFYNIVKGQTERDLMALTIDSLHIFRPSLLLGERKEFRFKEKIGEWAGKLVSFGLIGPLEKYRPIEADRVARSMVFAANTKGTGTHIYESDEIFQMAERYSIL
jgi:uncharacterized protein YbjT (DUF2867 family)